MTGDDKLMAKTKLLDTYSKYRNIKTTYKYHKAVKTLSGNPQIFVLKQNKGRGVVVLDRPLCKDKCLEILSYESTFRESTKEPTKSLKSKVQQSIKNIKHCLSDNEYKKLYPTGSAPGKFYGLAKIHKLKEGKDARKLPLRPIISNIGNSY